MLLSCGTIKLADFGLAKNLDECSMSCNTGAFGTLNWASPEVAAAFNGCTDDVHPEPADIFSLGLLYHYILSRGKHPFGSENENGRMKISIDLLRSGPPDMGALMQCGGMEIPIKLIVRMLEKAPDKRPAASECLELVSQWKVLEHQGQHAQQHEQFAIITSYKSGAQAQMLRIVDALRAHFGSRFGNRVVVRTLRNHAMRGDEFAAGSRSDVRARSILV